MANYPKDRFDEFPKSVQRRGAHRAPRTRLSKLGSWLIALASVLVLVAIGVGVMWAIDRQVQFTASLGSNKAQPTQSASATPTPTPTPTETTPEPDKTMPVTVLNGEGSGGLATAGSDLLTADGWTIADVGDADSYDNPTTMVYVASEEELPTAEAVVATLGFGAAAVNTDYAAPGTVVVVLGDDSLGLISG
ncbi:LytR C-terminal domain-containing protein [Gulosibacter hominis]|uniref:LytR C-terminal domain-containing protein n=1 Tax=Gulosibacter hominis TaxID=2770504 RepID=UPI00191A6364|nr:LytR C-terminal domain-containing protein [Gulosibacter hominis]